MVPDPPGLFSTMMFWPIRSCSIAVSTRTGTSVRPPTANGTMKVIGRLG